VIARGQPFAKRAFTIFSYAGGMERVAGIARLWLVAAALLAALLWSPAAQAQNCSAATGQGSAPASWQTYCWLNLANYNDTTARSATGQNLSFTLPDGSVLTFNARVTTTATTAYNTVTAPSWSGAAIGNTAFTGIPGRPVLYSASAGTSTITLSNIAVTPPVGGAAVAYAFVIADAESSNGGESLRYTTNGAAWQLLDTVPPISGSTMPQLAGIGSNTVTVTGVAGTVGAHIVSSNSPTSVSVETVAGGLQGVMFAVRFASIRLQKSIVGTRLATSDQFQFQILNTTSGQVMASGVTSGSGTGPFVTTTLVMSAGVPLTLRETMASGSASALSQYSAVLTCVNTAGPTRSSLPNNQATTSANIGVLQFGEALVCTFTNGAPPRLRVRKVLGSARRFAGDQFTVRIMGGETVVAASTTAGTSSTITSGTGDTGLVLVGAGQAYTVDEIAAGTGNLGNYTATMACSNATSGSPTSLPNAVGGAITLRPGDSITCSITNTAVNTAVLIVQKSSVVISDPVNGTVNPKAIPGAIVEYSITVRNAGNRAVDSNSLIMVDEMPGDMAFATGTPVAFTNGSPASGLNTFDASTMVRFSSQTGTPTNFNYSPVGAFDRNVRAIRIAPTGTMAAATSGTSQPSFTIRFRARLE